MRPYVAVTVLLVAGACSGHSAAPRAQQLPSPSGSASASAVETVAPTKSIPTAASSGSTPTPAPSGALPATPRPTVKAISAPTPTRAPSSPAPHVIPPAPGPTAQPIPKTVQLSMRNGDVFAPKAMSINAGDTVRVTNNDVIHHNWTESGIFASGDLPPLASFAFTFTRAGQYAYECTLHQPQMNGNITVR